jgi:PAS domain S-box-containing protein
LDEARLQKLAESSRLNLSILPFDEAKSRLPLPRGDPKPDFLSQRVGGQTIMGYSLVSDVYNAPTFYLGVNAPRDIYRNGQTSILVLSLAVLATGALFGGVLLITMERLVLARVENLSNSVNRISESADSSIRVEMSGTDELASLAATINRTMDSLQRSEQTLKENEERYRAILDAQIEFVCRWREGGILTFVNDAYSAYYGLPPQQLIGSSILSRVHPDDRERIKAYLASLGPENPRGEIERRVITPDGQVRWHQWTDQAILDEPGECHRVPIHRPRHNRAQLPRKSCTAGRRSRLPCMKFPGYQRPPRSPFAVTHHRRMGRAIIGRYRGVAVSVRTGTPAGSLCGQPPDF